METKWGQAMPTSSKTSHYTICSNCDSVNRVRETGPEDKSPVCGTCKTKLPLHTEILKASSRSLPRLIQVAEKPVVVDFWAEWCGPCKAFEPTFKTACQEMGSQFIFVKLDTESNPEAGSHYQIRGIPTLIVFINGKESERQSGAMSLPAFKQFLGKSK